MAQPNAKHLSLGHGAGDEALSGISTPIKEPKSQHSPQVRSPPKDNLKSFTGCPEKVLIWCEMWPRFNTG